MKRHFLYAVLLFISSGLYAQAPGSSSTYGGDVSVRSVASGGTVSDVSESLYIGSGMHIIDGTWEIYSKNVIVDPSAVISGSGTIRFFNPSAAGGASSATLFDGNNLSAAIDVDISLENASGMILTNAAFPADLTSAGWSDNASSSTLYLGSDLGLSTDGADIFLGTGVPGDLRLGTATTISNYRPARMIVTGNSILSHLVKESYTGSFIFPVGIADGDYTPAQVTNGGSNTVRVSVQDYTASVSPEETSDPGPGGIPADGMLRTWHIYGGTAGVSADINLQHNTLTNQSGFNEASCFVTQWGPDTPNTSGDVTVPFTNSPWQSNTAASGSTGNLITPSGSLSGSSMRSRSYSSLATSATAEESYFSKSSDPFHPLPVYLSRFEAAAQNCSVQVLWEAGSESGLSSYDLLHSSDGVRYSVLASIKVQPHKEQYRYIHQDAGDGLHFYRLRYTVEGTTQYSTTASVRVSCYAPPGNTISVYPNPAQEELTVSGMSAEQYYTLRLLSMEGKVVLQQYVEQRTDARLNLRGLPSASYTLQILNGNRLPVNVKVVKR